MFPEGIRSADFKSDKIYEVAFTFSWSDVFVLTNKIAIIIRYSHTSHGGQENDLEKRVVWRDIIMVPCLQTKIWGLRGYENISMCQFDYKYRGQISGKRGIFHIFEEYNQV